MNLSRDAQARGIHPREIIRFQLLRLFNSSTIHFKDIVSNARRVLPDFDRLNLAFDETSLFANISHFDRLVIQVFQREAITGCLQRCRDNRILKKLVKWLSKNSHRRLAGQGRIRQVDVDDNKRRESKRNQSATKESHAL